MLLKGGLKRSNWIRFVRIALMLLYTAIEKLLPGIVLMVYRYKKGLSSVNLENYKEYKII